ncbi:unnamed protein product, partial [Ectocarpus sp. 12 AP-2014]
MHRVSYVCMQLPFASGVGCDAQTKKSALAKELQGESNVLRRGEGQDQGV